MTEHTKVGQRFRFEDEEVYGLAMEVAELADTMAMRIRRERPWGASQLGRASLSVLTNTAEAHGEHSPGDKARFHRYASRSATETAAILSFLVRTGLVPPAAEQRLRSLLLRATRILTRRAAYFRERKRALRGRRPPSASVSESSAAAGRPPRAKRAVP